MNDSKTPELIVKIDGFKTEKDCLVNYCRRLLYIEKCQTEGLDITAAAVLDNLIEDAKLTLSNLVDGQSKTIT